MPSASSSRPVESLRAAVVTDTLAILAFVVIGRGAHAEGSALAGLVSTALPFLAGAGVGWVVLGRLQRQRRLLPAAPVAGVVMVVATVVVGMGLRRVIGGGTPVSFILVATGVLAVVLIGWRTIATVLDRRAQARG